MTPNQGAGSPPAQHYNQPPMQQQPQATQPMALTPGGGNRNALNKPYDQSGQRDWSHGLCDCCGDAATCVFAWCCPCMVYSQNKSRLQHLAQQGTPHPKGGEMFGGDCAIHALLLYFGCACFLQVCSLLSCCSWRVLTMVFIDGHSQG